MRKTINPPSNDKWNALFATTLRDFMEKHPDTGKKTTQKELAQFLGVRPQTVSYYCTGESLPNCEQLLKMAQFFDVTCDFLSHVLHLLFHKRGNTGTFYYGSSHCPIFDTAIYQRLCRGSGKIKFPTSAVRFG